MISPAMETVSRDDAKAVTRTTHFLTAGWMVHWLGLFVFTLPLKLFLKNHFHLEAEPVAMALFWAGFPFSIKPIFAWFGDSYPIAGYRRRSWTVLGGIMGAAFFMLLLLGVNDLRFYIWVLFLAQVGYVFVSSSLGGLLVEFGSRNGVLGALSSYRAAINQGINISVGPLAGFLASIWIGWTWCVCAACALVNGLLVFGCADHKYQPPKEKATSLIWGQLKSLFASRNYIFALIATALINIAPGFGTPLTFYQQDVLKFSEGQIGLLTMFNGIGGLIMGLICVVLSKKIALGRFFFVSVVLYSVGTLGYMMYTGFGRASAIEPIAGFVAAGATVAIFIMAGHAIPKGVESLGYSVLMAVNNLIFGFGDVLGSKLTSTYHIPFWQLVLLNSGTTLLALIILPFMPKTLKSVRDEAHLPPSGSRGQSGHVLDE